MQFCDCHDSQEKSHSGLPKDTAALIRAYMLACPYLLRTRCANSLLQPKWGSNTINKACSLILGKSIYTYSTDLLNFLLGAQTHI
jgi:hypothetical protein